MEKNQDAMKGVQSEFMGAHSVMLEVLGSAGQVKLTDERFNRKGPPEVKCMFCTMEFDGHELQRKYILKYHWNEMQINVIINIIVQVQLFNMHFIM